MTLTLQQANAIIAATLAEAGGSGTQPLGVTVLDAGGHVVSAQRQDGASLYRVDIARAKALGALGMGVDSAILAERAKANPTFFGSLAPVVAGGLVLSPGGLLIRAAGRVIGAVGVSGDAGERDAACAAAGIRAAGLACLEDN